MKRSIPETMRSLLRLGHFIFWYLLAISIIFLVLPKAAIYLQAQYEALPGSMRLVIGMILIMAIVASLFRMFRARQGETVRARLDQQPRP